MSDEVLAWLSAVCEVKMIYVKLMQLTPYHLLLHYYAKWFTFLVPAYPGCPGKKAIKWM